MSLHCLVLWRHGESHDNAVSRMQGQLDSRLTATGRSQAERAAAKLAALCPDILASSDLSRAAATAACLEHHCQQALRLDPRLRETHLGEWQGCTAADVEADWPGALAMWRRDPEWAPPGGEARVEAAGRAARLVAELDADGHRQAVLCTHGGLIAGLTPLLLGLPVSAWPGFAGIGNGHWTMLRRSRHSATEWRLEAYNTSGPL